MGQGIRKNNESKWGRVEIVPDDPGVQDRLRALQPGVPLTLTRWRWVPPRSWANELPNEFDFSLRCLTTDSGRRFYPWLGIDGHLATAFAGGLAALIEAFKLTGEQRFSYRAQWLLFQRLRATRERLNNQLKHPSSLRVRRSGRGLEARDSILPESVGENDPASGKLWCLDRLLDEGRKEARERGVSKPSASDCVCYGLLRAARLNPLQPKTSDVPGLLRMALYDPPPPLKLKAKDLKSKAKEKAAVTAQVIERVLEAVEPHLVDTSDHFLSWFQGPNNSFVAQIAKRVRAPGGALDRAVVCKVLSDEGWRAYQYVADCVHVALYRFRRLLPEPLNEVENRAFERMHLKQPFFGGLPSLMLAERFPQLNPILTDVWEEEDNGEAVAIMHRLLYYYSEMAAARRATDRLTQSRKAGTRNRGHITVDVELPSTVDEDFSSPKSASGEPSDVLDHVAERLRSRFGVSCRCQSSVWSLRSNEIEEEEDEADVVLYCRECNFEQDLRVSLRELRELVAT
jgi:hypothetical protein